MAKVIAKCIKKEVVNNDLFITLKISNNASKIEVDNNCNIGELEDVSIKKHFPKRTPKQNNYYWKLVGLIAKKMDQSPKEVSKLLLQDANIKYTICTVPLEAKKELEKYFKIVSLMNTDFEDSTIGVFQCFYGSSSLNMDEFGRLLETAIRWCENLNIPVEKYEN